VTKRSAMAHRAIHDHPKAARPVERVSLAGPAFEEVLIGLLKVDPKELKDEDKEEHK
jgi:hypothetical protein